jgi:hypothetical protein
MSPLEILVDQLHPPLDGLRMLVYVVTWVCSLLWVLLAINAARHGDWMPLLG